MKPVFRSSAVLYLQTLGSTARRTQPYVHAEYVLTANFCRTAHALPKTRRDRRIVSIRNINNMCRASV